MNLVTWVGAARRRGCRRRDRLAWPSRSWPGRRQHAGRRSRPAPPGSTAPRWASASASATRRSSSSWSISSFSGIRQDDLTHLSEYLELVAKATGMPIAIGTPIVGRDAFRTATGVHAAAVIKAQKKGDAWLADRIYSACRRAGSDASRRSRSATCRASPTSSTTWPRGDSTTPTRWLRQSCRRPRSLLGPLGRGNPGDGERSLAREGLSRRAGEGRWLLCCSYLFGRTPRPADGYCAALRLFVASSKALTGSLRHGTGR